MRFLIDRCAGRRLAEWLRARGHDVAEVRDAGPDPGDSAVLEQAAADDRILVTIDTDFGRLIYVGGIKHRGLIRLPDVPAEGRIALMAELLDRYAGDLEAGALVTVRGERIRISRSP